LTNIEQLLLAAITDAGPKPADSAPQASKKNWSQRLSDLLALAIAEDLRGRGLKGTMPNRPTALGLKTKLIPKGSERRLAGGVGAKKVDVTWATEESGLLLACSVKTIMFRDKQSQAFQKNLVNRRGDLLVEALTLHKRFPYAVVTAFLFIDVGAATDQTPRRRSTFVNAFPRLRLFTRRPDPSGREEQFERFYLILTDTTATTPSIQAFEVNDSSRPVDLSEAFDDISELLGERNFDLYEANNGHVSKL
jgi:hypothetical protein